MRHLVADIIEMSRSNTRGREKNTPWRTSPSRSNQAISVYVWCDSGQDNSVQTERHHNTQIIVGANGSGVFVWWHFVAPPPSKFHKNRQKHCSKTHLAHLRPSGRRNTHRWPEYSKPQGSRFTARNLCAVPGLYPFSVICKCIQEKVVLVSQYRGTKIAENIGLGDPENANNEDKIRQAARLGGAEEFVDRLPDGFESFIDRPVQDYYSDLPEGTKTLFGRPVDYSRIRGVGNMQATNSTSLSGGQMQRLALYVIVLSIMDCDWFCNKVSNFHAVCRCGTQGWPPLVWWTKCLPGSYCRAWWYPTVLHWLSYFLLAKFYRSLPETT